MPPQVTTELAAVTMTPSSLMAAVVDIENRSISGIIVPWGELGFTTAGPLRIGKDALRIPEDSSRLKIFPLHMPVGTPGREAVGYATVIRKDPTGLFASFKIKPGEDGDRALADAGVDKVKDGLSIEAINLQISGEDLIAGDLMGVALVPVPAFANARVSSVAASATPSETNPTEGHAAMPPLELISEAPPTAPFSINFTPDEAGASATPTAPVEPGTLAAGVAPGAGALGALPSPQASAPGGATSAPRRPSDSIESLDAFYGALASRFSGMAPQELQAALSDITQTAVGNDVKQPQWVGQLWDGVQYQRKIIPLFGTIKPLTSFKIAGWKWTTKPAVDVWAGDKNAVPSNAPATDPTTTTAERLAGAHDHDRSMIDFPNAEYWAAYYEAMTESYAKLSDTNALTSALAFATDQAAPDYEGFLGAIAFGAQELGDNLNVESSFVVANMADLIPWVLATSESNKNPKELLALIGIDLSRVVTHTSMTAGHVLVGSSNGMDYYELPGSPIRVEAVDMVKGGHDTGVFGYHAEVLHDALALQDVVIDAGA